MRRRTLWLLGLGVLFTTLMILLQTAWGLTTVVTLALRDAGVTVEQARGNWIRHVRAYGIRYRDDGVRVEIDTLDVRYNALALLRGTLHLRRVTATGLVFELDAVPRDTTAAPNPVDVRVDDFTLLRSALTLPLPRDTMLRVDVRELRGRISTRGALTGQLQPINLSAAAGTMPLQVTGKATIEGTAVRADSLRIWNHRSDVLLDGNASLPVAGRAPEAALTVRAAPLMLGDVALLTGLRGADEPVTLRAQVQSDGRQYDVHGEGAAGSGSLAFGAGLSPGAAYEVRHMEVRSMDLALLDSSLAGSVSWDLSGSLTGDRLSSLEGDVHLHLLPSAWDPLTLAGGDVRARLEDGKADVTANLGAAGAQVGLTGTVFLDKPSFPYEAAGYVTELDLSSLGVQIVTDLAGTIEASGHGADSAAVRLRLGPGQVGHRPLRYATADLRWRDSLLTLQATAQADTGSVALEADWTLGGDLRATVQLSELDVAGVASLSAPSAVSGEGLLQFAGNWPPDSGSVDLRLHSSSYAGIDLDTAWVAVALAGGLAYFSAEARQQAAALSLSGTAVPFASTPTYIVHTLRFDSVDVGAWIPGHSSALSGSARISGRGNDLHGLDLMLSPSTLNRQRIDSASVNATLRGSVLYSQTLVALPRGSLQSIVTGDLGRTAFKAQAAFSNLDLGALLNIDSLTTALTGSVDTLSVLGVDPGTLRFAADLRLDSSRVNDQSIDRGNIHVAADSGAFAALGEMTWAGGGLRLDSISGRWLDSDPTYRVHASARSLNLDAWVGMPGMLNGSLALAGEGRSLGDLALDYARITAHDAHWHDMSVATLRADLSLEGGVLSVDTLAVESNVLHLHGGGSLALVGHDAFRRSIALEGRVLDAAPLSARFLPRPVTNSSSTLDTLFVHLSSQGDSITFEGRAGLSSVATGSIRALDAVVGAHGAVRKEGSKWRELAVDSLWADVQRLSVPGLAMQTAQARVSLAGDTLGFSTQFVVDETRGGAAKGFVHVSDQELTLEALAVNLGEDRWHLDQEARLIYDEGLRVRNFLLVETDQEIALDGIINPRGQQSLALTLFNVRPGSVADLFGYPDLDGVVDGDLVLTGDARAPRLEGSLTASLEALDAPVGNLDVSLRYADRRLDLDAALAHVDGSTLSVAGHYPLDFVLDRTGPELPAYHDASMVMQADRFNIGWVTPFLDPALVSAVEGHLSGGITLEGTKASPRLLGSLALDEGLLTLAALGITAEGVGAHASFEGDSIVIDHMSARSGNGTFTGYGTVNVPALNIGAYDMRGTVDEFRVVDNEEALGHVTGDLRLRGTTQLPVLTGALRLTGADFRPTAGADHAHGPVAFTPEDVRMLERYFNIRVTGQDTTTFVFYNALTMDLALVVGEDTWLRSRSSPEMNIQFQGALDVTKDPGQDLRVLGTVQVEPAQSYVRQFGRRFDLDTGRITYNGPILDPLVDLRASYAVPARSSQDSPVTIFLDIEGSLMDASGLQLRLSSEPAILNESDIISYIATGRPAAEAFQMAGENTLEVGRDIAVSQLSNLIAGAAGAEIGLDVVQIEQDGSRGITLTAGKQISRDLFASISWPIVLGSGTNATGASAQDNREIIIEYSLFTWLLGRLRGNAEALGASVVVQYAY